MRDEKVQDVKDNHVYDLSKVSRMKREYTAAVYYYLFITLTLST